MRPINAGAGRRSDNSNQMGLRERRKLAKLPASTIYYQGSVQNHRNFFLFFMLLAILAEVFRFKTVYCNMQAELELRYEDEYYIWREVFIHGEDPEQALAKNAERKSNPDN